MQENDPKNWVPMVPVPVERKIIRNDAIDPRDEWVDDGMCDECEEPHKMEDICSECGNVFCDKACPPGYKQYFGPEGGRIFFCPECHPDVDVLCMECGKPLDVKPLEKHDGKPGRNDLCPCGSGKKYKRCCGK